MQNDKEFVLTPEQEEELEKALIETRYKCQYTDTYDLTDYFFYAGVKKALQLTQVFKPSKLPALFKPKEN